MARVRSIKRPPIEIDLGDEKKRTLKYTLNSFAEMEERYGKIDIAVKQMEDGSVKAIRFMLWAGLMHNNEELTEKEVGALLELTDLEYVGEKMSEAMDADLPDKKEIKSKVDDPKND